MKLFKILVLLVVIPFLSRAQVDTTSNSFPYKDGRIVYETVKEIPGISKTKLFGASKKWMADSFKSASHVIQSEDEPTGQIVGKGNTIITYVKKGALFGAGYNLEFTVQVDCKDDKYRIRIYDIKKINAAVGIIAADTMPLEEFDAAQTKRKKTERISNLIKMTNRRFQTIIDSFSDSITNKDDF